MRCECHARHAEHCPTCSDREVRPVCYACCSCVWLPVQPGDLDDDARVALLTAMHQRQRPLTDLAREWYSQVAASG